jgi:hypothetical protein
MLAYGWMNMDNIESILSDRSRARWSQGWQETADYINESLRECVPNTELIHGLRQGFVLPKPAIDPNITLQLHPLLRL